MKIKLFEAYSKDREEIVDFIDALPNKVYLYRGLILSEHEDVDKDNLGIHWTFDKYFAENIYQYETFKANEDYRLIVVSAVFDKKDIDVEKTIDKRLIKDSGHFWDELTGELIEFTDMDDEDIFHPYEHEDEVIIKPEAKPIKIDFEEVEIK